ncbi:MAG: hypothetical protein OXF88_21990 [Rhodobacteraceae bacterium]|nr:hypothetical protein [Paracoccaceae bacterium]MCY4138355.1 hypothetical protein [Paracoccaceae bacterium]
MAESKRVNSWTTTEDNLNGSVDLLAQAMRAASCEAVEKAVDPLTTEFKALHSEVHVMGDPPNAWIDTPNENMQAQFARQRKDVIEGIAANHEERRPTK